MDSSAITVDMPPQVLVAEAFGSLAKLGNWPACIEPKFLLDRIPNEADGRAAGFNAGLACALGLIPEEKRGLAMRLSATCTFKDIERVWHDCRQLEADSETAWWLAACSAEDRRSVDYGTFLGQIRLFRELSQSPKLRLGAAAEELERMKERVDFCNEIPYATEPGQLRAIFTTRRDWAVAFSRKEQTHFIVTCRHQLPLPGAPPAEDRLIDGVVYNQAQYITAKTWNELSLYFEQVKRVFGPPRPGPLT